MSCEALIKSGLKKGEKCNYKTKQGNKYCGKHKNYDSNKNIEKKEQKENKINTVVGDNGKNLSGGQKQRVGLARGFLKKTKILILDEATNQLDKKTEEKIYNNIEKNFPNITLIVITHNHNLLDFFDKVINLDEDESTITNI